MARKRKLNSQVPEAETPKTEASDISADINSESTPEPAPAPGRSAGRAGGMWGGSMMNLIQHRIEAAQTSLSAGILAGTVVIELTPEQIRDDVGSDRLTDWQADEAFEALKANIARRGQTQPIRVRPAEADWSPSEETPLDIQGAFIIQSGRRRLAACAALGIKVKAIVATEEGDALQADLEERFAENTMRAALNGFEELLSIGWLAQGMQDLTQTEIAARLGVPQGDISLGLSCIAYKDQILAQVDIERTPKRQYRTILPKLKRGEWLNAPPEPKEVERIDVRGVPMTTTRKPGGFVVNIPNARVTDQHLDDMLIDIAKIVMRYQSK